MSTQNPDVQVITNGLKQNITGLLQSIEWSGSDSEIARKVSLKIISSATDPNIPKVNIAIGSLLIIALGDEEVFQGYVMTRNKATDAITLDVTAYDGLFYVHKSKASVSLKKMTAEAFALMLCAKLGIEAGSFAATGIAHTKIYKDATYYEILRDLYHSASLQTGKRYNITMHQGRLNVHEYGVVTTTVNSFISCEYSEDVTNAITRVSVLRAGKKVSEVSGETQYGIITDEYTVEKGKDPIKAAKALLKGPEYSASVLIPGDRLCITGNRVELKDPYTGLVGAFWVASDTHVWESGLYTTKLELSFKEVI